MKKSKERCQTHPDFDPYNKSVFNRTEKYRNCSCCCGLHYATREIGSFAGEYEVSEIEKDRSIFVIEPTSLENFGHIRFSLGFDWHLDANGAPSWLIDAGKSLRIYFTDTKSEYWLKHYCEKGWFTVKKRTWEEPFVKCIRVNTSEVKDKNDSVDIHMELGESNQVLRLSLRSGMTVEDVYSVITNFKRDLRKIKVDSSKLSEVSFKKY